MSSDIRSNKQRRKPYLSQKKFKKIIKCLKKGYTAKEISENTAIEFSEKFIQYHFIARISKDSES